MSVYLVSGQSIICGMKFNEMKSGILEVSNGQCSVSLLDCALSKMNMKFLVFEKVEDLLISCDPFY